MMNCRDVAKILAAYVEEIVSSEEKNLVENHLSSCQGCRKAFEELKRTVALVRALEPVESPPWFTQKIMARVRSEQESRKSITQRMFYPLHIKVPLEAFATVLIAVAAVYLFKANEPEMKRIHIPPATEQAVSQDETSKQPADSKSDTTISAGEVALQKVPKPHKEKGVTQDKDQQTSAPTATEAPSPPVLAMEKEVPEKPSGPSELSSQHIQAHRQSPASTGTDSAAKTPARGEKVERKVSSAAPQITVSTFAKPEIIDVTLQTRDTKAAMRDVESILTQLGAQEIKRESLQSTEILRAEVDTEKIQELFEKLKLLGEVKETGSRAEKPKRTVGIRIEVVSLP